jgi:minor histocompatibility antigen H13
VTDLSRPMMVTVAKSLDIPIKILVPRPPDADDPSRAFGMLGLGDIVLPGFMIGMALRFDLHLHYMRLQRTSHAENGPANVEGNSVDGSTQNEKDTVSESTQTAGKPKYVPPIRHWSSRVWTSSRLLPPIFASGSFRKTYFTVSFLGYILGMAATEAAMHYANHAQPALLYLVPAVLISLLLTAVVRGELHAMWEYTEEEDEGRDATSGRVISKDEADSTEKKPRESFFSLARSAKVASKIASAASAPDEGVDAEDEMPAAPTEQSSSAVSDPSHKFRRDHERDIVFFSVGKVGPWASRLPETNGQADNGPQEGPKWVVPPHEREVPTDLGHAGKRLRTG